MIFSAAYCKHTFNKNNAEQQKLVSLAPKATPAINDNGLTIPIHSGSYTDQILRARVVALSWLLTFSYSPKIFTEPGLWDFLDV